MSILFKEKASLDLHNHLRVSGEIFEQGKAIEIKDVWYLGYFSFLWVTFKTGGVYLVILLQSSFSLLSGILIFRLSNAVVNNKRIALIAPLFYFLFLEPSIWNFYILTDSLYTSFCIISFYLIHQSEKARRSLLYVIPVLLFAILIRPSGFNLFAAIILYFIIKNDLQMKWLFPLGAIVIIIILNIILESFNLVEQYRSGEIIYNTSEYHNPDYDIPVLKNDELEVSEVSGPVMLKVIDFAIRNPLYFSKMCFLKFWYFVTHTKPYYSQVHNCFVLSMLIPFYMFSILGFMRFRKIIILQAIGLFMIFTTLSITFTVEDWDGRFLMPLIPFIGIMGSLGIFNIVERKNRYP